MLISIGAYDICDGTLANGVALSELHSIGDRKHDVIDALRQASPVPIDRIGRSTDFSFQVKRAHATLDDAENFILGLDAAIPSTGAVTVVTTGPSPVTVTIPNGAVLEHNLVQQQGATTFHKYRITGGAPT
jgi:hypothetical protein